MRSQKNLWLLALAAALAAACAPGSVPAPDPSPAPAPAPVELRLADGDLRVVNLYRIQADVLRAGRGESADTVVDRLVQRLYMPYTQFWNGYLGDEAAFRKWAVKLLDPAHPIHSRLASLDAVRLDRRFSEGVDWIVRTTGHRPAGTWYIVFGPGWTDMGGLGGIGMVADFTRLEPDSAALANLLPHELTHQVQSAREQADPDVGTVLHRIVAEGFASYVAWIHAGGRRTPAEALMYRESEWTWALAHERELLAAVRPILASRDRRDTDRVAARSERLIEGAPGAGGYFLGFRLVQAYVAQRGADSWKEIYDLPVAEVVRRSGYLELAGRASVDLRTSE